MSSFPNEMKLILLYDYVALLWGIYQEFVLIIILITGLDIIMADKFANVVFKYIWINCILIPVAPFTNMV